jgi:hypothetical protein
LRPLQAAQAGQEGEVIASLTKPDGTQIESSVLFSLLPPREREAKKAQDQVPPFEIKAVTPENSEVWNSLWPDDGDDVDRQKQHAYKVLPAGGVAIVYYSTVFPPYADAVEKLKAVSPVRMSLFVTNYEIWIGYHAILQHQQASTTDVDLGSEEQVDRLRDTERQTVARVQVRQALRIAEVLEQKAVYAEKTQ